MYYIYCDHSFVVSQFGWQGKKSHCLQNSLLKIPEKLTPRCCSPAACGIISPNIPRNPPTTPVSEFESRGSSPNPVQSRLNANAPPFIPGTAQDDPGSANENSGSGNENGDTADSVREHDIGTEEGQRLSPGLQTSASTPLGSEVQSEGSSTPVQTVGVPTPSLPSVEGSQSSNSEACRDVQQAAPEVVKSPHSNSSHSSSTQHQPPQVHTSPSHPLPSPSSALTVLPEATGRTDSMTDPPSSLSSHNPQDTHHTPTPHPSHHPQATHHTDTSTTAHKPKTWASIVRKNGSGSTQIATPTTSTAVHNTEENKVERKELVKEGEGGREGATKREVKEEEVASSVNSLHPSPSPHLRSLGGKVSIDIVRQCMSMSLSTDQLRYIHVSHTSVCLQPRGLINQGNWCYMHAVSLLKATCCSVCDGSS